MDEGCQGGELPHKKSTGKGNVASKINLLEKRDNLLEYQRR